ncbi:MAG: RecX family transcriptional regulator [Bacilli bacterium]|nr:RecX family transcriptional regulator [Bacilli bacterium]
MSEKRNGETVTILSIKVKDGRYTLSFSNGDKIEIGVDTFTEFHLYADKELNWDEYERLLAYARMDEAYRIALKRLSHDLYSKREMRDYLLGKGEDPQDVENVLERLVAADLVNDKRYATTFAEDVADLRLIGRNQILFTLRQKGISPSILEGLSFPREKELDKAMRYAKAADKKYHRTPKARRTLKISHALLRRGFDESVAFEAAEACASPDDQEAIKVDIKKAYENAFVKYSRKYQGYELRQHIFANLARRGYDYDDIREVCEEAGL